MRVHILLRGRTRLGVLRVRETKLLHTVELSWHRRSCGWLQDQSGLESSHLRPGSRPKERHSRLGFGARRRVFRPRVLLVATRIAVFRGRKTWFCIQIRVRHLPTLNAPSLQRQVAGCEAPAAIPRGVWSGLGAEEDELQE